MNTFNPMQMLNNMSKRSTPQFFNPTQQNNQINQQQLINAIPNLNKNQLSQFVMQARAQGMSDEVIEEGLNFLLSFK